MDSRLIEKTPNTTVTASTVAKAVMTLLLIFMFWNETTRLSYMKMGIYL